MNNITN